MKKTFCLYLLLISCAHANTRGVISYESVTSHEGDTTIEYEFKGKSISKHNLQKLDDCVYLGMVSMDSKKIPTYKCREIE